MTSLPSRSLALLMLACLTVTGWLAPSPLRAQFGLDNKPVTGALIAEHSAIAPGKSFKVAVKLVHQPTWHVYGKTIPEGAPGLPTKVTWKLPDGWKVDELPWPPTHRIQSTGGVMMDSYEGTVHLPYQLTPPSGLAAGGTVDLEGHVDALVCDPQTCMPVKLPFKLTLPVAETSVVDAAHTVVFSQAAQETKAAPAGTVESASPAATPTDKDGGLADKLLLAFLGGLILNIMPCVFPVLGIKILGIVKQAGENQRKVLFHGLSYTAGVLLSFWALASLLLVLRSGGEQLGWGFQLQSPAFVLTLTFFLFIFGLNMAGLFEVGSSAVGVGAGLTHRSGLGGSFFSGLLATVVATPCAAPFLAPALAYALGLPTLPSLLFFTVIGLGLAFPFLLLSAFPKLVARLPRPGAWMESFKQAMSFLMFATVAFLLWTLAGMVDEYRFLDILFGLVLAAVACWIYGRWSLPHKPTSTRVKATLLALLFLVGGVVLASSPREKGLEWANWSPELVEKLRSENKPVYIDFTARWCVTCQTNKLVYNDTDLQDDFKRHGVVTLKADWTNQDEVIFKALQALGKAAVPVNVLYVPGQKEPIVLNELLTVAHVKDTLAKLDNPVAAK